MQEEAVPLLTSINSDTPIDDSKNKSTTIGVYFTFVAGFIGGGLLGLPYGFKNGGLFACAVGLVLLAIISNFTVRLLHTCKVDYRDGKKPIQSYADIGEACFGRPGVILVNISIIISQLGYCCAYVVFIGKNLSTLTFTPSFLVTWEFVLMVLPLICLLVWLRNMKYLQPTSILANVAIILSVVAVLEYGFANDGIKPLSTYEPFIRFRTFPIFYGIVAFGYTIHGLALDIHSSMRDPSKYTRVLDLAMLFVTIIYLLFGSLAYLFFGDETKSVITLNLGSTIENDIIKLALSVVLLFAYPLQMFPVVQIVEGKIFRNGENQRIKNNSLDTTLRNILRVVLVACTAGAAIGIPLFGYFSSFVGTFSNSFIAFIFPPICYLKLFRGKVSTPKIIACVITIIIGVVGLVVGSAVVVDDIVEALINHTND